MKSTNQGTRIGIAIVVILGTIIYLAVSGVQANKSYYVTIQELEGMGNKAYTRHLRVARNVQPGSIQHKGSDADFVLVENTRTLRVSYKGDEPPPPKLTQHGVLEAVADPTWKVGTGSFAGYRVDEDSLGVGVHTAVGRTPAVSGTMSLRTFLRRLRSVSGSLREMPLVVPSGT